MYGVCMCVHMYLPSPGAKTQSHIIVRDGFESDESTSRGDAGCVLRLSGLGREYVLRTRGGTCAGGVWLAASSLSAACLCPKWRETGMGVPVFAVWCNQSRTGQVASC